MAARNQRPTYDFLVGAPSPSPPPQQQRAHQLRDTLRQSQAARPAAGLPSPVTDLSNEDLRAQLKTLQYELDTLKQDRAVTQLQQQQDVRDAQQRAAADFERAQAAERAAQAATRKADALARELHEHQTRAANERAELERKARAAQERAREADEEAQEAREERASAERGARHRLDEAEARLARVQEALEDARAELQGRAAELGRTQGALAKKEEEADALQSELVKLRSVSGDVGGYEMVKRQLSDQVAHIRRLEHANREQAAELAALHKQHRSVELVEEEKRGLENRLRAIDGLRRELAEAQLRCQVLEDERRAWSSYLETEGARESGDDELRFESPEDLARAYIRERLETASLLDRLGAVQPELSVREQNIRALEDEKAALKSELEKLHASQGGAAAAAAGEAADARARARLERQKALAIRENEYLRAQFKAFDAEASEFHADSFDEVKSARIQELEGLIDSYRKELETVHADLSKAEQQASQRQPPAAAVSAGTKRPLEDAANGDATTSDERVGELRRKNRHLQDALAKQQKKAGVLEADLRAAQAQLASLRASSRVRVLELRSNPTADAEALKLSTVTTLRAENRALREQLLLEGGGGDDAAAAAAETKENAGAGARRKPDAVPAASLAAAQAEMAELRAELAQRDKKAQRMREVWSAKSAEFREAVASLLGWRLEFMPSGRVRATSLFYPGGDAAAGEANNIVFDGENGTMKVSGGPQSRFAREIADHIAFWVEGKKEIPCFLAAMTLDFYENKYEGQKSGG
ncbi:spindle assembly checkpoint component Mad1 [Lineolata rhizophorae]|uniref:Spindle assembly checkpoint component MAD1 n=1 Tax=Lineolata rhizophorae TaxID=578093 RepID=A0A6A6NUX5_9PEZI|nr:spindle assembly checkpoint component Mad1 [Lineolata rhizophorae]